MPQQDLTQRGGQRQSWLNSLGARFMIRGGSGNLEVAPPMGEKAFRALANARA